MAYTLTLKLARESRGLSQTELAVQSGVSQATLSKYEKGRAHISETQLASIAKILNYPTSLFSMEIQPLRNDTLCYRKRKTMSVRDVNMIESKIAILNNSIDELLQSIELPELSFQHIEVTSKMRPEEIAFKIREWLKLPPGPIDNFINVLERNGVLVANLRMEGAEKFDGLSMLTSTNSPIIWLNSEMPNDRKRFTLAHELGHIIMHLRSEDMTKSDEEKDVEANAFAEEFLLPRNQCYDDFFNLKYSDLWLKKMYWKVSKAFIVRRAGAIGSISSRTKEYLQITLGRNGERKTETGSVYLDMPTAIKKMVNLHLTELEYTIDELSEVLGISVGDINQDLLYNKRPNLNKIFLFNR